jgi:hypothetical protein
MVSSEAAWAKMSVMTVGSFHDFIKHVIWVYVLQVKVNVLQKIMIFMFSFSTDYSSLEDSHAKASFSQNIEYNLSSSFKTNTFNIFSQIFMDLYRFL